MKFIESLVDGQVVTLTFLEQDNPFQLKGEFLGIQGADEERRAEFFLPSESNSFTAYRKDGEWVYGPNANKLVIE